MLGVTQNVVLPTTKAENAGAKAMMQRYFPPGKVSDLDWRDGTTILRLYHKSDGFDGMAWCIPPGIRCPSAFPLPANGPALSEDVLFAADADEVCPPSHSLRRRLPRPFKPGQGKMESSTPTPGRVGPTGYLPPLPTTKSGGRPPPGSTWLHRPRARPCPSSESWHRLRAAIKPE
ncbi:MAG: hypothetical protein R2838_07130 [Caldilineaceae bacterium]